jgi:hypothetical protein
VVILSKIGVAAALLLTPSAVADPALAGTTTAVLITGPASAPKSQFS